MIFTKFCCSVNQLCPTLFNPMDCSTPDFPAFTFSWSLLKLMSIESVMPSNHLILWRPLLLLPVFLFYMFSKGCMSFPCSSAGKESTCNAEDPGLIPGLGRSPGGGQGNPLQYSCLENPYKQRSLAGYSQWDCKEVNMTEWLSTALCKGYTAIQFDE